MTTETATKKFTLPPLPYPDTALAPYISAETLHYHHDKHHAAYVEKLNALIADTPFAAAESLEEIILQAEGPIFNNAAQAWNHNFYFAQFAPHPSPLAEGELSRAIAAAFGDEEQLREQINRDAVALFGSGWVWLASDTHGQLCIVSKSNAGNPMTDGLYPLLTVDVWEHAYYIDHRNARAEALRSFWKVLSWPVIEERYAKIGRPKSE